MFANPKSPHSPDRISSYRVSQRLVARWRRWAIAILLATVCFIFIQTLQRHALRPLHEPGLQVYNTTLGFQKVYAIGFPERSDKRDAFALATALTGFDVEWEKGVAFEDVNKKAAPVEWDFERETPGALGCWRAHMNVMQRIVNEDIQSALIMEDDSDWDVSLRDQLFELSHGSRGILGQENLQGEASAPYGTDWDYMYLGHCRAGPRNDATSFYVIENDHTVPPVGSRHAIWRNHYVPDAILSNSTRLVFRAHAGMCAYAYAVTQTGARRILATIGLNSPSEAVDSSFSNLCRQAMGISFRCLGVYPPLFSSHRAAGPNSRDSDLNIKGPGSHEEYTWDVVYSTMLNIMSLVEGAGSVLAQWPDRVKYPTLAWPQEQPYKRKGLMAVMDLTSYAKRDIKVMRRSDVYRKRSPSLLGASASRNANTSFAPYIALLSAMRCPGIDLNRTQVTFWQGIAVKKNLDINAWAGEIGDRLFG